MKIGDLKDYTEVDNVSTRVGLDPTVNNHGKALREFLIDAKCCLLNGRAMPEHDNYSFISTRGKSVVNFVFTPHECINQVQTFHVDTCSDIITDLGWRP